MPRLKTREELKQYALRALGAPVIRINVDDLQLEDRIDDALDLFIEYHADATQRVFAHHQITPEDFRTREMVLPDSIYSVVGILDGTSGAGGGATGIADVNLQYQAFITDVMSAKKMNGGASTYYITMQYLQTMSDTFSTPGRFEFNTHTKKLTLTGGWEGLAEGQWIAIESYQLVPEENVWDNRWLKKYVTALFKYQWGSNLIKFPNVQLSGNISVNAEQIFQTAQQEMKELEEQLQSDYALPHDFFVG